jgi:hypothetical protein
MAVGTASSKELASDRDVLCLHTMPSCTISTPRDIDMTSELAVQCLSVRGPGSVQSTALSEERCTHGGQRVQPFYGCSRAGGQWRLEEEGGGGGRGGSTDCQ